MILFQKQKNFVEMLAEFRLLNVHPNLKWLQTQSYIQYNPRHGYQNLNSNLRFYDYMIQLRQAIQILSRILIMVGSYDSTKIKNIGDRIITRFYDSTILPSDPTRVVLIIKKILYSSFYFFFFENWEILLIKVSKKRPKAIKGHLKCLSVGKSHWGKKRCRTPFKG